MDYEKKYKEALDRAKKFYANAREAGNYNAVARFENIFPELRESEDEKIRKEIKRFILDTIGEISLDDKENAWLNWLEKQEEKSEKPIFPEKENEVMGTREEQKPAEWSEEDEKTRNSIIEAIHNLWPYEHRDKCIQWLKSLRPSWKPSEEQPEVDFEKAYKSYVKSRKDDLSGNAVTVNMKDIARHFYELGLNARK